MNNTPVSPRRRSRGSRRTILLVLLLCLMLAVIFCCAQVSLLAVKPNRLDVVVRPQTTADYGPWPWFSFRPIDPVLATLVVQEQATLFSQTTTRVPGTAIAEAAEQTLTTRNIEASLTQFVFVSDTPGVSLTASPPTTDTPDMLTSTPSNTPSESATVIRTSTPPLTVTASVTATATATATATLTATVTPTAASTVTPIPTATFTIPPPAAPVASFWATPTSGMAPLAVFFTNTSTGNITSYAWNFGDGIGVSNQANPAYTYANPGVYVVTLTVFGPGGYSSATGVVNVGSPPPIASFYPNPASGYAPLNVAFANTSSGAITSYSWSLGDGSGFSNLASPAHTYTNPGVYVITLTVFGPGGSSTANGTVQVFAPPATATRTPTRTPTRTLTPTDTPTATDTPTLTNTPVTVSADLAVVKTVSNPTPNEGDAVTYTIMLTNDGPDPATGIELTDLLPGGVTFSTAVPSQGTYAAGSGIWTVGTLASGTIATLDLSITVNSGTVGTSITNTAAISAANEPDPVPGNNSASVNITVQSPPSADLSVNKQVDNASPAEGDMITYTVTLYNGGPSTATSVEVMDPLLGGLTLVGASASQGTYIGGLGLWSVGSVAAGTNATLTIQATVNPGTGGMVILNAAAAVFADQPDPNWFNNTGSVNITVRSSPVANDDTAATTFGTAVVINVAANDSDADGNLNPGSVSVIVNPPNGAILGVDPGTGAVTYQPNPTFSGNDSFTYQICDTTGLCDTATVTISVSPGETVIIDNADSSGVVAVGFWQSTTIDPGYYGIDIWFDLGVGKGTKTVTFTPNLAGGTYEVYQWWTADGNHATNTPIDIHHAGGTSTVTVNQQANGSQWNLLGTYQFAAGTGGYLRIRTDGTVGFVIADAVRFVQISNP